MNLQEAWSIIETYLYPDYYRCTECAEGGCDWPDCECPCHGIESEAGGQLTQAISEAKEDSAMLDFLEQQNSLARYTGKCIFRLSMRGRGWRLHETGLPGSVRSVRQAIDEAIREQLTQAIGAVKESIDAGWVDERTVRDAFVRILSKMGVSETEMARQGLLLMEDTE